MADKYQEPDRIKQYMASLEANLEKATGKSLAQWVKIAKTCPHSKTRDRLNWFKTKHGLGMSRAMIVLWRTFGAASLGEDDPNLLVEQLFSKSFVEQRDIYERVVAFVLKLGSGSVSPRKGYVALYRLKQYGALKPSKKGLLLGLALKKYPKIEGLIEVKNFGGGDRNKMVLVLTCAQDFDARAKQLLTAAFNEA